MNLSLQTRVAADPENDYIDAGFGNDWVAGQAGSDVIYGGDGDDILYGDDAVALPEGMAEGDDILVKETSAGNSVYSDYIYIRIGSYCSGFVFGKR